VAGAEHESQRSSRRRDDVEKQQGGEGRGAAPAVHTGKAAPDPPGAHSLPNAGGPAHHQDGQHHSERHEDEGCDRQHGDCQGDPHQDQEDPNQQRRHREDPAYRRPTATQDVSLFAPTPRWHTDLQEFTED
jgi:hypothetical protein